MPGLADFEVPSFIKPPSQAEAQQLAMDRERLTIASQEAADKMFERMQRRVAFTKMMGEAKTMEAAKVDPMTARSQAFLNNADKLYMGDPDGYARATSAVESAMDQRTAQREFQDYMRTELAKPGADPGDVLFKGWTTFGPRISKTAFNGYSGAYLRSQTAAKTLEQRKTEFEEKQQEFQQREKRIQSMDTSGLELKKSKLALEQSKAEETARHNLETESGKATEPTVKVIGGKDFIVNPKTGHFQELDKNVSKATFISQHITKWMNDLGITEDEAAARLEKFYDTHINPKSQATPPAEPGAKRLKWNPTTQSLE